MTMSVWAVFQSSPVMSNVCIVVGPSSPKRSGDEGGVTKVPTWRLKKSSALMASVGCNFTSFETKNVKKNGLPCPKKRKETERSKESDGEIIIIMMMMMMMMKAMMNYRHTTQAQQQKQDK